MKILRCVLESETPLTIPRIADKLGVQENEIRWVSEECDSGSKIFWWHGRGEDGEWRLKLSMTGRQFLLDHESLQDARSSSQISVYIAIAAIVAAIMLAIF